MKLVVISYPGHYHITQLAIKQAKECMDGVTAIHVVWDDTVITAPDDYIPFSSIVSIPSYIKGWYKQQIVKLNLHKVFPNEEIVIIDGDVILHTKKYPKEYFYAPLLGPEITMFNKAKDVLGIDQFDFLATRFMYVDTTWLEAIHKINPNLNQIYRNLTMSNWSLNGRWPLSEWELIYQYVNGVSKKNKGVIPFDYDLLKTSEFESKFTTNKDVVLDGRDKLSQDFYHKNGITINKNIWNATY